MNYLFVHQNFAGQYLHLVRHLGAQPGNQVVFLTQHQHFTLPGVRVIRYRPPRAPSPGVHHYLQDTEAAILNGQSVARIALDLRASGFVPDVMAGHNGWGEIWYLKDVYPDVPLIGYFEFFYRQFGADVGFDPGDAHSPDTGPRIRSKNMGNLLGLDTVDIGVCPTHWQRSGYPARYHDKLRLMHEGIDTAWASPLDSATFRLPSGRILSKEDEVLTYVARNLEPHRGFPMFMRSLPGILSRRPHAEVLIVGADGTSYGPPRADGRSYREAMRAELEDDVDWTRVHFLNQVPYGQFRDMLRVSRCHVYLTYPFVLSWSMLEAMSMGCVVVGSCTAPVTEVIVDEDNGFLVDFFDTDMLVRKVVDVLEAGPALAAMRSSARSTIVERYDLQAVCLPRQLALLTEARELLRGRAHTFS
jgi:glycosyltransferase involved in cell wall biosynthesis